MPTILYPKHVFGSTWLTFDRQSRNGYRYCVLMVAATAGEEDSFANQVCEERAQAIKVAALFNCPAVRR
jgi:hypothetical protein